VARLRFLAESCYAFSDSLPRTRCSTDARVRSLNPSRIATATMIRILVIVHDDASCVVHSFTTSANVIPCIEMGRMPQLRKAQPTRLATVQMANWSRIILSGEAV
jgi:hypothetical protein